jgi:hypothetical protein
MIFINMEKIIEKAREIHGDKYDYSKVEYKNNKIKIKILCSIHGEFEQTPNAHIDAKHGCPKCSLINRGIKRRNTTTKFIEEAKKIHGDKYDYTLVNYEFNDKKVKIICSIHGIFNQEPISHLKGCGCPICAGVGRNTTTKFIEEAKKIHGDKYDYTLVNYENVKTKIKIICRKHGIFSILSNNFLNGQGCARCAGQNKTTEDFIEEAEKIHGNKYDYSLVNYEKSKNKVAIKCQKHGVFKQRANNHLNGIGCPICNESRGEGSIRKFLDEKNISFIRQYRFKDCKYKRSLPFDFYLPDFNTCIEYDGEQHFKPKHNWGGIQEYNMTVKKDNIKTDYCISNNLKLIRIPYTTKDIHKFLFENGLQFD